MLKQIKTLRNFKSYCVVFSLLAMIGCKTEGGPAIEICIGNNKVHGFNCVGADGQEYIKEYLLLDSYICTNPEDLKKEVIYLKSRK